MLRRLRLQRNTNIPNISSSKSQPVSNNFRRGIVTYPPNDERPKDALDVAQDVRFASTGNYKTRKGCDTYSVPIGETVNVQETSTTGAADKSFSYTTRYAQKLTTTATNNATRIDIRLKNDASATGTVMLELYSDNSGSPGTLLGRTSIAESDIGGSYAYEVSRLIAAPSLANATAYHVVAYTQEGGTGSYKVSSTTNSTTAKISTDAGQTWSSTSYSINVKLYTSTAGKVKGLRRVYRPDGTPATFFAHKSTLYKVTDSDGTTTAIDTGLDANAEYCRLEFVNDTLYYVTGLQKPRKYNWSAASEVATAPENAKSLVEHVGLIFYLSAADQNKMYFTNFADYEVFTSTDFIYIPAPKRSDVATALATLNGSLYTFTQNNKYVLYGQDNATFRLDEAAAQKGTFSQESTVWDQNYVYFASDDGVYRFNGTSEENIIFNQGLGIQDKWDAITEKENTVLEIHNNRLYIWYTPTGQSVNTECFVWNILLGVWESIDTNTYIGRAFARHDTTDLFLQGSNEVGAVYYAEKSTNDYTNLGDIMSADLETNYSPFGTPQQLKSIRKFRPDFVSQAGRYSAQVGAAADFSSDVTFYDIPLQGTGFTYDSADALYDSATYASSAQLHITTINIPGEAYRWRRYYKHHAAREPIEFTGETLTLQTQRIR